MAKGIGTSYTQAIADFDTSDKEYREWCMKQGYNADFELSIVAYLTKSSK